MTGEFRRGDVVVGGQDGDGLRGVDVVVVGEAVVGGFGLCLCPRTSAQPLACAPCGRPPLTLNYQPVLY